MYSYWPELDVYDEEIGRDDQAKADASSSKVIFDWPNKYEVIKYFRDPQLAKSNFNFLQN